MASHRTNIDIPHHEKAIAHPVDSEQAGLDEHRLRDALEDDDVLEALERLHHEPSVSQQHAPLEIDPIPAAN